MKHFAAAVCSALVLVTGLAAAEEKAANVHTLPVTTVYGQRQRPAAAIEIARARMTLPPTTPTLSGLSKIQDTAKKDPF
jgi:hypothetical protein